MDSELDRGHGIPYKGNYSAWLEQKGDRLKKEESSESARQKALKKRAGMGTPKSERPSGQEQGASRTIPRIVEPRISNA